MQRILRPILAATAAGALVALGITVSAATSLPDANGYVVDATYWNAGGNSTTLVNPGDSFNLTVTSEQPAAGDPANAAVYTVTWNPAVLDFTGASAGTCTTNPGTVSCTFTNGMDHPGSAKSVAFNFKANPDAAPGTTTTVEAEVNLGPPTSASISDITVDAPLQVGIAPTPTPTATPTPKPTSSPATVPTPATNTSTTGSTTTPGLPDTGHPAK